MASRVNTRFVILLIAGVVALLGLLILAYSVAVKSAGDLAKRGDQFMQEGDYKQAELAYSKAVNKDVTNTENIQKWIDSLEKIVPETETEYTDRFRDYLGAIRKTATIQRNNVEAHERFLQFNNMILQSRYSRAQADAIINDTSGVLAYFDNRSDGIEDWERLKRFRGLAIVEIAKRSGELTDDQFELAIEDLTRAIEADSDDVESVIGLMNIRAILVSRDSPDHDLDAPIASLEASKGMADEFLATHPNNAKMKIQRILIEADIARREIMKTSRGADLINAVTESYASFEGDLIEIADLLVGSARDQLDLKAVNSLASLESAIAPDSKMSTTRRLIDAMIEEDNENAELLGLAGQVAKEVGDFEESLGWFSRIDELETKPLSYEGLRQYDIQRQSLLAQATIRIDMAQALSPDAPQDEVGSAIAAAEETRDRFASSVTEDNLSLVMLNGKIARLKGDLNEALRLFVKFNEQTQRINPEGLWQEGVTASQIGQYGVARKALAEMIPIDPSNRKLLAMLTLARVNVQLRDYLAASNIYKEILAISPTMQIAQDGLDNVNKLLNPELNEDPVIAAVFTSRQMRLGTEDTPGDYAGAIEYLRNAVEELDYAPMISQELASLLLDSNNIGGAKEILQKSADLNPDDAQLHKMLSAISSEDTTDILVEMIRMSDRDAFDKLLSIAQVGADRNRPDLLSESVDELNAIAPDDIRVIELSFVNAVKKDDLETARQIAARTDISRVESLGFQARLAASEDNPTRAIELLEQAAATGTADASVYQMLAILQRETGDPRTAIQSFQRALAIRPDNSSTITEYIVTLAGTGQYEEALSNARRLQRYGSSNPTFMNLWLNLESIYGGQQGRDFAIRQRERMLELNPADLDNKYQLARMYNSGKQWDEARTLIDELRSAGDGLPFVELEAAWYADQGTYQGRSGLVLANEVFAKYIDGLEPPVGAEPYISNAEFMLARGRPDLAVIAANEAVKRQTPETMLGSKLLGDLYSRINNLSDAVLAYQEVVAAGADEDYSIRKRLISSYTRLARYEEAQEAYDQLPEEMKTDMIAMLQAADIARGLGDNAKARSILDDTVARYSTDSYVYIKRAESMIGDPTLFNDLLSDISRAIDLQANDWRAFRVRAAGYFAVDRREDALKDLRTTIRLNPNLDKSIFAVLNELLSQDGRAGEALDMAREVIARRPDDANLMARIAGLFASRKEWNKASEIYGMAWEKRHAVSDGAMYIDSLVRMSPPDSQTANDVITELAELVGDINESSGLLAAQALVLQARGRDDFAIQQITKAFDLSVDSDEDILNWSGNISRFFEDQPSGAQIQYLETLKRRNTNADVQAWLDLFIARRLLSESSSDQQALDILKALEGYDANATVQVRAYRLHGSTLFGQNNFEEAAAVWKEGLGLFSDDWELNNNLAYVLASKLDRAEEALPYGQSAIDKNIQRSEAYETMAGIYIQLGKFDEAEQMIEMGSNYILTIPARITMILTSGRLRLARGNIVEARSRVNDAKSVMRSSPTAYPSLNADIEGFEQEIDSAGD
jgi:tetratricopeptide (TPR) repeat protein